MKKQFFLQIKNSLRKNLERYFRGFVGVQFYDFVANPVRKYFSFYQYNILALFLAGIAASFISKSYVYSRSKKQ